MSLLKERIIRELDRLGPSELLAVQQLIESLGQPSKQPSRRGGEAARRVRDTLAHLQGTLSEAIDQEREERL